jgi:hypothetical protein
VRHTVDYIKGHDGLRASRRLDTAGVVWCFLK